MNTVSSLGQCLVVSTMLGPGAAVALCVAQGYLRLNASMAKSTAAVRGEQGSRRASDTRDWGRFHDP